MLLADGDAVAFLPPVSGGTTAALVDGPIDLAEVDTRTSFLGKELAAPLLTARGVKKVTVSG